MMRLNFMKAEELDQMFDEGVEILEHFDLSSARHPGLETKRVNVDFPIWMVDALDREAQRVGVHRQAIIKTWIAGILDQKTV